MGYGIPNTISDLKIKFEMGNLEFIDPNLQFQAEFEKLPAEDL